MATNRWLGRAAPVARVVRLTVAGTPANGDTITYTIGGVAVTYTLGSAPTAAIAAAGLYALLATSESPYFAAITWTYTDGDDFVTGTAAAAGVPWAGTASDTGTTTLTETETTANSSPNSAGQTANWSLGALPTTGDDVLIDGGPDILWDLDDLSAAVYGSLRVKASFTGAVGLPFRDGDTLEYRERFFPVGTGVPVTIGEGDGSGPTRVNLDVDTALSCVVRGSGQRQAADGSPVVNIKGCSSGTLTVAGGSVGLAADDDTTAATATTVNLDNDGALAVGRGATATTVNQTGGTLTGAGAVTTLNITAGAAVLYSNPTTVTADGGSVDCRFTGTVTTATFRGQGPGAEAPVCECTNDPRGRTFTNCTFTGGARLNDPEKSVTFTNAGTWDRASLAVSDIGARFTLQRT